MASAERICGSFRYSFSPPKEKQPNIALSSLTTKTINPISTGHALGKGQARQPGAETHPGSVAVHNVGGIDYRPVDGFSRRNVHTVHIHVQHDKSSRERNSVKN